MSTKRLAKEQKKAQKEEQSLDERLTAIEALISPENNEIQNIHLILDTVRAQSNGIRQLQAKQQELSMEIGINNAFLQTKDLQQEHAEFKQNLLNNVKRVEPDGKEIPPEQEEKTMTDEQKQAVIDAHKKKIIAEDEKKIVNEADNEETDAEAVIDETEKEVVNDNTN